MRPAGDESAGGAEPRPYGGNGSAGGGLAAVAGLAARNVGATLAVARKDGG
jgi:acetyl esterase/lipase